MRKIYAFLLGVLTLGLVSSCQPEPPKAEDLAIIPVPQSVVPQGGTYSVNAQTKIVYTAGDPETEKVARFLVDLVNPATGFTIKAEAVVDPKVEKNAIVLMRKGTKAADTVDGAYHLAVTKNNVAIEAPTAMGLFYGVQTLRQLLPAKIESREVVADVKWEVPCVVVEDAPRFPYRGLHLDVGRHFQPMPFIKKFIDLLALHKMNIFHWHLTEDQGWRIEIKKYPKLAEIASQRKETLIGHGGHQPFKFDGKPYGGYYTQEEVKEIVAYAQDRFITIIPEIELPGHSLAALSAYPELGCTGGPYEAATRWGVFKEVYCAGKEETFEFLEDVMTEVCDLFPSKYIHIGGDECPKASWKVCPKCQARIKKEGLKNEHELQSYFIQRMEKFLLTKGRNIIGWDEILEGGLAPQATVMSWRGTKGGIEAAKQHHDVIMTPGSHCYLDHYQAEPENEPLAIGGWLPLEKVYSYEPVPEELTKEEAKHILGAQGNVWTEYMKTSDYVEYMVYPRACALSEVVWSPKESKDYGNFKKRLTQHLKRLEQLDVNYCPKLDVPMERPKKEEKK